MILVLKASRAIIEGKRNMRTLPNAINNNPILNAVQDHAMINGLDEYQTLRLMILALDEENELMRKVILKAAMERTITMWNPEPKCNASEG